MLEQYKKAFKAYDIRALYGEEIDERFAYTMGKAIGQHLLYTYGENSSFLLGCDVREPNPLLIQHFATGMRKVGFSNISYATFQKSKQYPYGICSTPALYYFGQNDFDLAVSITASHNGPEYVGMKFFDRGVTLLSTEMLRELFEKTYDENEKIVLDFSVDFTLSDTLVKKEKKLYELLESKWKHLQKKHHFVVDFSNGSGVTLEKNFLQNYVAQKHNIDMINDTPDGSFSAHHSDTQEHKNYEQLIDKVKENEADPATGDSRAEFGLMWDGDADRIGIVGSDAKVIGGDIITAIIAKQILLEELARLPRKARNDSKPIVLYETMSSQVVKEKVAEFGGEARMTRVGRYFINIQLKECEGIFAGESSGHFLFADIGGYEMPLIALYYFLKELESYDNWEALMNAYHKYFKSPILSVVVADKESALAKIQAEYVGYGQKSVDGLSVYAPDFWFNLRPSNTEDKIRFTVEADTEEKMNEVVGEIEQLITNN